MEWGGVGLVWLLHMAWANVGGVGSTLGLCMSPQHVATAASTWRLLAVNPHPALPPRLPHAGCGTCGRTHPPTAAPRCSRATCTPLRRTCCAATGAQMVLRCGAGDEKGPRGRVAACTLARGEALL